ncbi:MAG: hypothetical protein ACPG7F_17180, partial [Aggregatilineales bacterium]
SRANAPSINRSRRFSSCRISFSFIERIIEPDYHGGNVMVEKRGESVRLKKVVHARFISDISITG